MIYRNLQSKGTQFSETLHDFIGDRFQFVVQQRVVDFLRPLVHRLHHRSQLFPLFFAQHGRVRKHFLTAKLSFEQVEGERSRRFGRIFRGFLGFGVGLLEADLLMMRVGIGRQNGGRGTGSSWEAWNGR